MVAIRKNFVGFVDVLEGYGGSLYQSRFFDIEGLKSIVNASVTPDVFSLCDDVWFAGWLSVANISRIVVNPSIHDDAPVRLELIRRGKERSVVNKPIPMSAAKKASVSNGLKWFDCRRLQTED